jgi:arylsulfatase A-like enzyme
VWEGGIRVPLLVRGPGVKPGLCVTTRASTVDIFPTLAAMAGVRTPLPPDIEGGDLSAVLGGVGGAQVKRSREELVVHFPHYDKGEEGPASVLLLGNDKLIHTYEDGRSQLFNLAIDRAERRDLAAQQPEKTAQLEQRLSAYLQAVKAQMPARNPAYDPSAPPPSRKKKERDADKKKEAA